MADDHKGHDTVTAAEEWGLKKEGLAQKQHRCHQIIQLKENELLDLRKAVKTLKTAEEDSDKLLAEIEKEIAELKRTDAEMKQLAMTQDPIYFLKNIVSIPDDAYNTVWTRKTFRFFQPMQKSVSALNRQLEEKLDLIVKQEGSRYERKHTALDRNRFTPLPGSPPVYLLKLKPAAGQLNRKEFGEASYSNRSNKTIMLVGATGSGKTTLINGMINYILGVDWEANWRFKLIDKETNKWQAHSQTSEVTAYQIHHTEEFKIPHAITIIDTPGFGDTRGIKQDKVITDRIRQFFTNKDGIGAIDAVYFVVHAALARLTHTQKYIFEAILSVFGKNFASNIITLVTFADGKNPNVLEAIKEANIPCATQDGSPVHFKFNIVLFADNTRDSSDEEDSHHEFYHMFWKIGNASMKNFFTQLGKMETRSLTLTKQVLQERKQLEATVTGVQPLIRHGLATMEEIRSTQAVLDRHKNTIEANKDFEYEVEVEKADRIDIPYGTFITYCHSCNYTCHYPCSTPKDDDKHKCAAMHNGYCTVCPGKCPSSAHFKMNYKWETKRVREKRTYQELRSKYAKAMGEKMNQEQIVEKMEEEYCKVQDKILEMMNTVTTCLTRLKEIALRPDPLSTPDYIDLMIKSEEQEAKPGFKQRIKELQVVREGAVLMQKVSDKVRRNTDNSRCED
ncbi:uncharacterized protein LOC134435163 [Engraulis encrasicolus]|uniref:uncharacterized protein LOC134435163 n=1 Tax=Engraulis encrasicolus TaxID=184585 RepID=UPI002FCF3A54